MNPSENSDVFHSVRQGDVPVFLLRAVAATRLSEAVRQLLRDLRATGARLEFHDGAAGEVMQAINRLLADVPVDAIAGGGSEGALRVLLIDNGENLPIDELRALRRITSGLRGSVLRVIVAERVTPGAQPEASIAGKFGDLAAVWTLDHDTNVMAVSAEVSAAESPTLVAQPVVPTREVVAVETAPVAATPSVATTRSVATTPSSSSGDRLEIPDVLFDLAKERGGRPPNSRLSDGWRGRWAALAIAGLILLSGLVYGVWVQQPRAQPGEKRFFDCGLHPDRESIEVLVGQVARSTPTRVREEEGKFRLEVGPFADQTSLEAVRSQLWRLGACQSRPSIEQSMSRIHLEVEGNV
jgi:hypothetical protein